MGKATQNLRDEHKSILHVLRILDKMMLTDTKKDIVKLKYYDELVGFLKIFADKCHHGKEEKYFFGELINKGITNEVILIEELLEEHNQSRKYISGMSNSLTIKNVEEFNVVAAKYRNLLMSHIEKENDILFGIADQLLNEEAQDDLFERFERYEESVIGPGVHEELHELIHKWATEFEGQ